jgi:hypothetical protein
MLTVTTAAQGENGPRSLDREPSSVVHHRAWGQRAPVTSPDARGRGLWPEDACSDRPLASTRGACGRLAGFVPTDPARGHKPNRIRRYPQEGRRLPCALADPTKDLQKLTFSLRFAWRIGWRAAPLKIVVSPVRVRVSPSESAAKWVGLDRGRYPNGSVWAGERCRRLNRRPKLLPIEPGLRISRSLMKEPQGT